MPDPFVQRDRDGDRKRIENEIEPREDQQPGTDVLETQRLHMERLNPGA